MFEKHSITHFPDGPQVGFEKTLKILECDGEKGYTVCELVKTKKEEEKNVEHSLDSKPINEKKSTGGIFFALIKNDPEGKDILNKASKLDWKQSKQRKKVYKLMDKLNL